MSFYVEFEDATKDDIQELKKSYGKTGLVQDLFKAGKLFISRCQRPDEKAENFGNDLRKLLQVHPNEVSYCNGS